MLLLGALGAVQRLERVVRCRYAFQNEISDDGFMSRHRIKCALL